MITIYNYFNRPVSNNNNVSFCKRHPFYSTVTVLLIALGLTLALAAIAKCKRALAPLLQLKENKIALAVSIYFGVDYLGYSLLLLCQDRPSQRAAFTVLDAFRNGEHSGFDRPSSDASHAPHECQITLDDGGGTCTFPSLFEDVAFNHLPENPRRITEGLAAITRLTNEEYETPIGYYSERGYQLTNGLLREGHIPSVHDRQNNAGFIDALCMTPTDIARDACTIVLSMADQLASIDPSPGISYRLSYHSDEYINQHFQVGNTHIDRAFLSTDRTMPDPTTEAYRNVMTDSQVMLTIHGKSGRDISQESRLQHRENEILFLPNTAFTVVNFQYTGWGSITKHGQAYRFNRYQAVLQEV